MGKFETLFMHSTYVLVNETRAGYAGRVCDVPPPPPPSPQLEVEGLIFAYSFSFSSFKGLLELKFLKRIND